MGISDDTVSKSIERLESLGIWKRRYSKKVDPETGQVIKRLHVLPDDILLSHPEPAVAAADAAQVPERNHGGKRVHCKSCGSDDIIERTVYVCRGCGEQWNAYERIVNCTSQDADTGSGSGRPEEFPHPQLASMGESIALYPQVAGTGVGPISPMAVSTDRNIAPLWIHAHEADAMNTPASPETFPSPQDGSVWRYSMSSTASDVSTSWVHCRKRSCQG